jgi:hypothetical protein
MALQEMLILMRIAEIHVAKMKYFFGRTRVAGVRFPFSDHRAR